MDLFWEIVWDKGIRKVRLEIWETSFMFVDILNVIQAIMNQIKNARSEVILLSELTFFSDNNELGHSSS